MTTTTEHTIQTLPETTDLRAVLANFGDPAGVTAGSFTTRLIQTIVVADPKNLRSLAVGFPALVGAVLAIQRIDGAIGRMAELSRMATQHEGYQAAQEKVRMDITRALFQIGVY